MLMFYQSRDYVLTVLGQLTANGSKAFCKVKGMPVKRSLSSLDSAPKQSMIQRDNGVIAHLQIASAHAVEIQRLLQRQAELR